MSVGGVLGGLFCALFAPLMFDWTYEHPILLIAAAWCLGAKAVLPRLARAVRRTRAVAARVAARRRRSHHPRAPGDARRRSTSQGDALAPHASFGVAGACSRSATASLFTAALAALMMLSRRLDQDRAQLEPGG